MKKLLILSLVALWVSVADAQYFTHTYDANHSSYLGFAFGSGFNTKYRGQGCIIAGTVVAADGEHTVVKTAINGNPTFEKRYALHTFSGTANVSSGNTKVFELPDSSGYGVIGLCRDSLTGKFAFFYHKIDLNGAPTGTAKRYYPRSSPYILSQVNAVAVSTSKQDVFAVGVTDSGSAIMVLKLNISTGNIIWSSIFTTTSASVKMLPSDLIVNPYSTNNIVICGNLKNGTNYEGLIFTVNGSTGAAISNFMTYGTLTSNDALSAIKRMSNTIGGNDGFILSGTVNPSSTTGDMWVLAVDRTFASVLASKRVPYSGGLATQAADIIERFNTLGQYEYFMTGTAVGPISMTVKLNNTLGAVINGEYTTTTSYQPSFKIDQYNGTANDGLSIFGLLLDASNTSRQLCIHRTYFNGVTSCNQSINTTTANNYTISTDNFPINRDTGYVDSVLTVGANNINDSLICSSASVPGGSNAKVYNPKNDRMVLSPNPAHANDIITIQLTKEEKSLSAQPVIVSIFDLAGKKYYERKETLIANNDNIMVNLTDANIQDGLYFVTLSGQSVQKHVLLRVIR